MKNQNEEPGRIRLKASEDEVSIFQRAEKKREKKPGILIILFLIYVCLFFYSLLFLVEYSAGARWQFSAAYALRIIRMNLQNFYTFVIGNGAPGGIDYQIIRYLMVGLVGASLAACGALMQGTFRNVLAGPSTLGVQSGGTLANMIYVLFFYSTVDVVTIYSYDNITEIARQSTFFDRNLQQLLVLGGCLFGLLFVMGIATIAGKGKVSSSAMILAGTVFSSVIGSFCSLIQYYIIIKDPTDPRIEVIRGMSMGSFSRAYSLEHLCSMAVILLPCILILAMISGKMNILAFGEEAARTMGMDVKRYKYIMMGVSTMMSAVVTAYVGQIGFIGFMVPQIARKVIGPDFRRLFPACVISGALLLTVIYDIARILGMTDSLNLFTSVIGSIVMVFVLLNKKGGMRREA